LGDLQFKAIPLNHRNINSIIKQFATWFLTETSGIFFWGIELLFFFRQLLRLSVTTPPHP